MTRIRPWGALLLAASAACAAPPFRPDADRAPAATPQAAAPATAASAPASASAPAAGPAAAPVRQEAAPARRPGSFEELYAQAEEHAPQLLLADARHAAARERTAQATELPDPMLRLTWWAEEVQTRSGPMDARLMATQRFPWPGRLDAAGAVAEAGARAAGAAVAASRAELRLRMALDWNERIRQARAAGILAAHAELLREIEGIARIEAERQGARPSGLMRVQVDLGQVLDRVAALAEAGLQVHARLEVMSGLALDTERDWGAEPFVGVAAPPPADAQVQERHPLLRVHAEQVAAARERIEVAELAGMPDMELGVDYTFIGDAGAPGVESGRDAVSLSFGIALPFGSAADDAREAEARAELGARLADQRGARLQLEGRLRAKRSAFEDARRRRALYADDLLPQAEEAFAAAIDGYQARKAPFLEVLDTTRDLLRLRLDALQAEADEAAAALELAYLTLPSDDREPQR